MTAPTEVLTQIFGPWGVLIAASVPTVISGTWVAWRWLVERHDKSAEAVLSAEEQEALRLERERLALSAGQQQLFANVAGENQRLRDELVAVRADRDRGWAFARRCEERMHKLYHQLIGARQIVDSDRELAGRTAYAWPELAPLPTEQD